MSIWRLLFFLTLLVSVLGLGHYYFWRRLIRDPALPRPWTQLISLLLVLLLATIPMTMMLLRTTPRETLAPLAFLAYGWMGTISTFTALLVCGDFTRMLIQRLRPKRNSESSEVDDPQRRATLSRLFAGGVAVTGTAMTGVALEKVIAGFSVVEVDVKLDKLPKEFDGFKVVQLSDIHVGPTIGRDFVERMVSTANELEPDLIAITGDLVDGSVKNLGRHTAPLEHLRATHGTFFVTGNHEYYSGAEDWIREMARLGIPTLRNDSVRLKKGESSLLVAGVTDHRAGEFGRRARPRACPTATPKRGGSSASCPSATRNSASTKA